MNRGPFEPNFEDLPKQIPLFPLSGALLLPGGRLPLNIFEPRYLAMVKDAMATSGRLIGMIQTQSHLQKADGQKLMRKKMSFFLSDALAVLLISQNQMMGGS